MIRTSHITLGLKLGLLSLAGFLFACGGGGGSGSTESTTTTITGSVVAAPVNGAELVVKDSNGITIAGPVTTGADGTYRVEIPNGAVGTALLFESSGGTFKDEAMQQEGKAGLMAAYVDADTYSAGQGVHLTPASTIVHHLMQNHGQTHVQARATFKNAFGFDVDTSIAPVDVTEATAAEASESSRLAGLRAAAFSMLNMNLGLSVVASTDQFAMFVALAKDIVDGKFNGLDAAGIVIEITDTKSLPADIQNRFSHALAMMHAETVAKTGLTNDKIGSLPFAKTAVAGQFTVEYIPAKPMMNEVVGKTSFTLSIKNAAGEPAMDEMVSLMPMMHMATMTHATPNEGCTMVDSAGKSVCTVYYSMASSMNGMSMGFWELKVMIGATMGVDAHGMPTMVGGETATFYPDVMMAMGDTALTKLYGIGDTIMGMAMDGMDAMPEARTYYLFNEGLMGGDFKLFLAAKENMMSFPGVSPDTLLKSGGTLPDLNTTGMKVEVSKDTTTGWQDAFSDGKGHWSAAGLGMANTLYVRVRINGEVKTTDGKDDVGTNSYTAFNFSAMSM